MMSFARPFLILGRVTQNDNSHSDEAVMVLSTAALEAACTLSV